MDILYDCQVFTQQAYGGASRYFWELAQRAAALPEANVTVLACAHFNEYLRRSDSPLIRGRYIPIVPKTRVLRDAVNAALTRRWFARHAPQIVHETNYRSAAWSAHPYKTVVTVHDMVHEKFSEYVQSRDATAQRKADAVRRADHVICISESTRRDLLERIPLDPAQVSVIYHGWSQLLESAEALSSKNRPYLLYVGPRVGYKNFDHLLQAYAQSKALQTDFDLICFGSFAFTDEERRRIQDLGAPQERIRHQTGPDATLSRLYRQAALFVYPSLYEGFGIPPLEAMSLSCPVACSSTSSLPEVVGDAAQLFDPADVESIRHAIEQVVFSPGRIAALKQQGMARSAQFSWDKCAAETDAVYRSLL